MNEELLESIGLTKNESKTYLALLSQGTSQTGAILKKAQLNSGKIYEILESLKQKGLVSESMVNKKRFFTAAHPQQIIEYLEEKKKKVDEEEKTITEMMPSLLELQEKNTLPVHAETFTGLRGFKTAADEAAAKMKEGDEVLVMGSTKKKDARFSQFWLTWSQANIVPNNINQRIIFSEKSDYARTWGDVPRVKVRYLSGLTPVAVLMFGKQVFVVNYEEPASLISIQGENIAASFIQFFEQLWKIAK